MKVYYVYILASRQNGTLYIGVTSDLIRRVYEHKKHMVEGFTTKYQVGLLVYYETYGDVHDALNREKTMKKWNRTWKLALIEKHNPGWDDLYEKLV